ncbi:hypothetical protein WN944_024200 [Citrus x changshan-huyou]|uniref:Reverse transcriptase Ty1/copia-type domain-containing protein n=1 Tax=Citrus x changshan-huyou TaxID=2935761 RepID=A0AAP0LQ64_9ROSI
MTPTQMQTPLSNYDSHVIRTLATLQEKQKDTIVAEDQSDNNLTASLNESISEEQNCNNTATSSTKVTNSDKIQTENSLSTDLTSSDRTQTEDPFSTNQKNYSDISGKLLVDFSSYTKNQPTTLSDISGNPVVDLTRPQQLQTNLSSSQNSHSMISRQKANNNHNLALQASQNQPIEPKTLKSALKNPIWVTAMEEEIKALHDNNTWHLVLRPIHNIVIGSKWVYRIKYKEDRTIDRYKARLVAKGFTQISGVDFDETFSPVIKPTTIRLVMAIAVSSKWPMKKLDVKNAFLHGKLKETVYMEQPPGFKNPNLSSFVCKLNKSIYGLK